MMCTHFAVLISLSVTVKIIQSVICLFAPHITDHYQVPSTVLPGTHSTHGSNPKIGLDSTRGRICSIGFHLRRMIVSTVLSILYLLVRKLNNGCGCLSFEIDVTPMTLLGLGTSVTQNLNLNSDMYVEPTVNINSH
jgi:hypothetical protein